MTLTVEKVQHPAWCEGDCKVCRTEDDAAFRREVEARGWNDPLPETRVTLLCFSCGQPTPNHGRCVDCQAAVEMRRPHP